MFLENSVSAYRGAVHAQRGPRCAEHHPGRGGGQGEARARGLLPRVQARRGRERQDGRHGGPRPAALGDQ